MTMPTAEQFTIKPHHCGISIPDLEASIEWYRDMLGFSLESRVTIEAANAEIAFIKRGGFRIELFEVSGATPLPDCRREPNQDLATHGTKHIALEVSDLTGLMAYLKRQGVDVAIDVQPVENTIMAFIRDNSGILIELIQYIDSPSDGK